MPEPASSIKSIERSRSYYWTGALLVLVAAFCFACKGILIKIAYQAYPIDAISLLTLRMVMALPFYIVIAWRLSKTTDATNLTARQWLYLIVIGITGYYLASYLNFLGLIYITASLERVLLFIYPTFVLLLGTFFLGRRIKPMQYGALVLIYIGILVTFAPNVDSGEQLNLFWGSFWVIASGIVYAVYLVGSDRFIARIGSQKFTCYAMIAATVPTALHGTIQHGVGAFFNYPAPVYGISGVMAVFVTVVPTFMIAEGIRRIGSGNASIVASIGPIFTIVLASTFLHERISFLQALGTLLVLAGVVWIGWKGKQ
jgi:drug/metabolite transporter (DMT)-like permease